jgi:hypothetical protein
MYLFLSPLTSYMILFLITIIICYFALKDPFFFLFLYNEDLTDLYDLLNILVGMK